MRSPIARQTRSNEAFLTVVLITRGASFLAGSRGNRWQALLAGCLVLYVPSPVYAADGAPRSSTQPAGGEPPTPLLPTPVDPSESVLSEYTPQAPPDQKPPPYTLLRFN